MADPVLIHAQTLKEMMLHARSERLTECCGLLAGRDGVITTIFPAKNDLASATAYEIAPRELFQLFRSIRVAGLAHMGLYHSHPSGENVPSPSDIEQAYYPEQTYFIISPREDAPSPVRAFSIRGGAVHELAIISMGA
jgi:proteasome lid subunit RPN8/RPN11